VEEQTVEQPRLPAGAERDNATVVDDLERSKKPELDRLFALLLHGCPCFGGS
jgi:hypothetical protein